MLYWSVIFIKIKLSLIKQLIFNLVNLKITVFYACNESKFIVIIFVMDNGF